MELRRKNLVKLRVATSRAKHRAVKDNTLNEKSEPDEAVNVKSEPDGAVNVQSEPHGAVNMKSEPNALDFKHMAVADWSFKTKSAQVVVDGVSYETKDVQPMEPKHKHMSSVLANFNINGEVVVCKVATIWWGILDNPVKPVGAPMFRKFGDQAYSMQNREPWAGVV